MAAPFIDSKGKLASLGVTEAESASLADDGMIAWQRVAGYWRDSGTLARWGQRGRVQLCRPRRQPLHRQ